MGGNSGSGPWSLKAVSYPHTQRKQRNMEITLEGIAMVISAVTGAIGLYLKHRRKK